MSSDVKLKKVVLPPDVIDLSYGEPKVITSALFKQLNRFGDPFKMPILSDLSKWEYPPAAGKPDLVSLLEKKHGAKIVVCNGAKQALAAAMYALKKTNHNNIYHDTPYYPASPQFIELAGLNTSELDQADCMLITSPNNPDGKNYTNEELIVLSKRCTMVHDAAYYTDIYLPDEQIPIPVGDVQIFSISKMYGLSGLRVGYAVVHNEKLYDYICDYVEIMTAGVSTASQDIVRNIELYFTSNPQLLKSFISESRRALISSRQVLSALDPTVLVPQHTQANSMFAWCTTGPNLDAAKAKVHMLDGSIFGKPGMTRMNIAHPVSVIKEAVERLNLNKR